MPFAFGHLITAWLVGKATEKTRKIKLLKLEWFLILFGALFPDIDFLLDWTLGTHLHRTFTHSLFIVIVGFLIVYFIFKILKSPNALKLGLYFSIGIITHLVADMIMGYPGISLLWPLEYRFWFFNVIKGYTTQHLDEITKEVLVNRLKFAIFDMGLGVFWIGYLFFRNKIKEF